VRLVTCAGSAWRCLLNRPSISARWLDLVKINADLGRLGGLIKMWLTTNADFESLSAQSLHHKLENTLSNLRLLQTKMSNRLNDF